MMARTTYKFAMKSKVSDVYYACVNEEALKCYSKCCIYGEFLEIQYTTKCIDVAAYLFSSSLVDWFIGNSEIIRLNLVYVLL